MLEEYQYLTPISGTYAQTIQNEDQTHNYDSTNIKPIRISMPTPRLSQLTFDDDPPTPIATINTFDSNSTQARKMYKQASFISSGQSSRRESSVSLNSRTSFSSLESVPKSVQNTTGKTWAQFNRNEPNKRSNPFSGKLEKFKHRTPDFVLAYSKKRDEPENCKLAQYRRNYLKQLENYGLDIVHDVPGGFTQAEYDQLFKKKTNFTFIPLHRGKRWGHAATFGALIPKSAVIGNFSYFLILFSSQRRAKYCRESIKALIQRFLTILEFLNFPIHKGPPCQKK